MTYEIARTHALDDARRIENAIEGLWTWLEDEPTLGDDGVAELVQELETRAVVLGARLNAKPERRP